MSFKVAEMLYEWQKAWIRVRLRVTRRLIRVQYVCMWQFSRAWLMVKNTSGRLLFRLIHIMRRNLRKGVLSRDKYRIHDARRLIRA